MFMSLQNTSLLFCFVFIQEGGKFQISFFTYFLDADTSNQIQTIRSYSVEETEKQRCLPNFCSYKTR